MKHHIKRLLAVVAPKWSAVLFAVRARRHAHAVVRGWGCGPLNDLLLARLGSAVRAGPFAGLMLTRHASAEHLGPFLLGVYESELDPAWEVVLRGRYSQIVDVGASFGYYAAGLARRFRDTTVVAFDIDPWARRALRDMAALNDLANLDIRGSCDAGWLAAHLSPEALIVCDCEGCEGELLASRPVPNLATATLIVELHERAAPGVTRRLTERFGPTHDLQTFSATSARRTATDGLEFLSPPERDFVNHEVRGPQQWLLCAPRPAREDIPAFAHRDRV